ncbi:MAG: hypothetical protein U0575_06545 [Phycisphaerales bacterium]
MPRQNLTCVVRRIRFVSIAFAAGAAGCTVTAMKPTEADRNRELVQQLQKEVSQLERRNAELESALGAARRQALPAAATIDAETMAAAPFAATLRIGRFSGLVDESKDGKPDLLRLYLEPRDGQDRTVQVAGRAVVTVVQRQSDGSELEVGSAALDPAAWRRAFVSGFMGSYYSVDVPLSATIDPRSPVLVRAALDDAFTGRTLRTEGPLRFDASLDAAPYPDSARRSPADSL